MVGWDGYMDGERGRKEGLGQNCAGTWRVAPVLGRLETFDSVVSREPAKNAATNSGGGNQADGRETGWTTELGEGRVQDAREFGGGDGGGRGSWRRADVVPMRLLPVPGLSADCAGHESITVTIV